jgi:predicted signal transduction protein with EAL and GGDEF domain
VLLPGSDHAAGIEVARRILALLAAPFVIDQRSVVAGTSIGIAATTSAAAGGDTLFKHADIALYEGKENGRGSFRLFDAQMEARLQDRLTLETDMRVGLADGQFHLHYQPLVHTGSNRVVGFEALMRWSHPERDVISPAAFIPVAEETGMIVPLGRLALREACREAAGWDGDARVAVNLSPKQFRDRGLVQAVGDALRESGLPPHRLELEITESSLLQDEASVHATLNELRALGVRMALDDFGTGYSSLSYLQKFPFDKIKIDRAFVVRMTQSPDSAAIVRTIVSLAQHLRMTTTAEGVETADMLALVRDAGCTEAQGFHLSRPLPPGEAAKLLRAPSEPALQD